MDTVESFRRRVRKRRIYVYVNPFGRKIIHFFGIEMVFSYFIASLISLTIAIIFIVIAIIYTPILIDIVSIIITVAYTILTIVLSNIGINQKTLDDRFHVLKTSIEDLGNKLDGRFERLEKILIEIRDELRKK